MVIDFMFPTKSFIKIIVVDTAKFLGTLIGKTLFLKVKAVYSVSVCKTIPEKFRVLVT